MHGPTRSLWGQVLTVVFSSCLEDKATPGMYAGPRDMEKVHVLSTWVRLDLGHLVQ